MSFPVTTQNLDSVRVTVNRKQTDMPGGQQGDRNRNMAILPLSRDRLTFLETFLVAPLKAFLFFERLEILSS